MVNFEAIKSEKGLRTLIKRNLNKEIHPGTKPVSILSTRYWKMRMGAI